MSLVGAVSRRRMMLGTKDGYAKPYPLLGCHLEPTLEGIVESRLTSQNMKQWLHKFISAKEGIVQYERLIGPYSPEYTARWGNPRPGIRIEYVEHPPWDGEQAIHSLRALLRQCTYLPDPAARSYMHSFILARYRVYCPHPNKHFSFTTHNTMITPKRRTKILKEARNAVSQLARANSGHFRCLQKVLLLTYGRTGRLRHEFLKDVRMPDIPQDHNALSDLASSKKTADEGPQLAPKLQAVIRAQRMQKALNLSRSVKIQLRPTTPETNSWGRSMPLKRVRNMQKDWYAETLEKVLPPLPESAWTRLRDLATGCIPWEGPVPRRAGHKGFEFESRILGNAHVITPRYMRRMWARIFLQCPKVDYDLEAGRWTAKWGSLQAAEVLPIVKAGDIDPMFTGVNTNGKVIGLA